MRRILRNFFILKSAVVVCALLVFFPVLAQEKKAKAEKVSVDIGLVDLEKNYMIVVTKEAKLITIEFDDKTKVTKWTPQKAKVGDIGLGTSITVTYKDKVVDLETFEFRVKAKKGE